MTVWLWFYCVEWPYFHRKYVLWDVMSKYIPAFVFALFVSFGAVAQDSDNTDAPKSDAPKKEQAKKENKAEKPTSDDPMAEFYRKAEEQAKGGTYCHKPEPMT